MLTREQKWEIEKLEKRIRARKERISKVQRLGKLAKNEDLLSEYDAIINQADCAINSVVSMEDPIDAHKEQILTHSYARLKKAAIALKESISQPEKQIDMLNAEVERDNEAITRLQGGSNKRGREII